MGGSQSTRKISVENNNAIQVSQEAIDRIQQQLAAKQPAPQPQQQPQYAAPPPPYYYEPPNRQQDNSAEEAYWARRIENLKRAHDKINIGMQNEYQKTLKEANELFQSAQSDKIVTKLPPCQDEKAKVLQCYSQNADKSLLCSVVVNEFNECVCKSRIAAITATS